MKQHLLLIVRQHCAHAKILELHGKYEEKALESADGWVAIACSPPQKLAQAVDRLIRKNPKR